MTILLLACYRHCIGQSTPDQEVTMCPGDTVTMSALILDADSLQWYRNEVPIAGANNDTLVYMDGGLFYLRAFSGNALCADQSGDIRVFIATPLAQDDHMPIPLGKLTAFDVLGNDKPLCAAFDRKTFTIISPPTVGTLVSFENGYITYKPPNAIGYDKFTYKVADIDGRYTNEATVYFELYVDCAIVYPNPVDHMLNIKVDNRNVHSVKMYDAVGRELRHIMIDKAFLQIDMSGYSQGLYILEFLEEGGYASCVIKIQKK